eukprot:ctg_126.g70
MMAGEVPLGTYLQNGDGKRVQIVRVERVHRRGAYAPLTEAGTLLVDDHWVSCYGNIRSHDVAHAVFAPLRTLYRVRQWLPVKWRMSAQLEGLHWYATLLLRIRLVVNRLVLTRFEETSGRDRGCSSEGPDVAFGIESGRTRVGFLRELGTDRPSHQPHLPPPHPRRHGVPNHSPSHLPSPRLPPPSSPHSGPTARTAGDPSHIPHPQPERERGHDAQLYPVRLHAGQCAAQDQPEDLSQLRLDHSRGERGRSAAVVHRGRGGCRQLQLADRIKCARGVRQCRVEQLGCAGRAVGRQLAGARFQLYLRRGAGRSYRL